MANPKEWHLKEGSGTPAFSPDGKTLATGGFDRRARLWRVYAGTHFVDMARRTVPRQLTDAERERFGLVAAEEKAKAEVQ